MNHLSPWDLSGVGMGFGLYRPRRPSYTFATQTQQRQRSESYRYAVRKGTSESDEPVDFIEGIIQRKNRKESYIRATRHDDPSDVELSDVKAAMKALDEDLEAASGSVDTPQRSVPTSPVIFINGEGASEYKSSEALNHSNHEEQYGKLNGTQRHSLPNTVNDNHIKELKEVVSRKRYSPNHESPGRGLNQNSNRIRKTGMALPIKDTEEDSVFTSELHDADYDVTTPTSGETPPITGFRRIRFKKNLVLLCVSFILIFNAFRAIQNLQSTLNSDRYLGIISMATVHGTMCLTCLWAPVIINQLTAKWTLVFGMSTYILWIAVNFYPRFYTLIPFGILAGVGKGILWTAESSYILKLSFDYSRVTNEGLEKEMFRFHGIFLACFQTTHIWGNLMSSLVLHSAKSGRETHHLPMNMTIIGGELIADEHCGVLFPCQQSSSSGKFPRML
ncbi:hypothetical protein ACF0H5_020284 [Mactra antiquata]